MTRKKSNKRASRSEPLPEPRSNISDDPTMLPETSIEQQLDMVEEGGEGLRGDDVLHQHGVNPHRPRADRDPLPADALTERFEMDMSEPDREGDDMSGDEHSSGLQGGESEVARDPHIDSGLLGEVEEDQELEIRNLERKRAG